MGTKHRMAKDVEKWKEDATTTRKSKKKKKI